MPNDHNQQILQAITELNNQMNEGFRKIDQRFEALEKRFDDMEEKQEKMQNSIDILARRELDNEVDIMGLKEGSSTTVISLYK